ncbi:MAG: hypothetical protein OCC49_09010 [Fibrobacterales bacterium]
MQLEALSGFVTVDKSLLEEGDVELSKAPGEVLRLIVMLNGTQIAELTEAQSNEYLDKFPSLFQQVEASGGGSSKKSVLAKHFSSAKNILQLGAWKEGITVTPGFEAAFSGALMFKAKTEIEFVKKFGMFYAGGAIGYKGYVQGKLPDKIKEENDSYGPSSSLPVIARAIVAAPFLKIEAEYDGNYLPEYHWLQENDKVYWNYKDYQILKEEFGEEDAVIGSKDDELDPPGVMRYDDIKDLNKKLQYNLVQSDKMTADEYEEYMNEDYQSRIDKMDGQIVDYFNGANGTTTDRSPLTVTATAKFGVLHAAGIWSPSYTGPLFRIYIDELELFVGKWGMGVISSKKSNGDMTFVPGVWVDVYEFDLKSMNAGVVKWSPLKLYFHKLNRSFLMGVSSTFRFDFAK